jgi:phosphomevalonate kinase
VGSAGFVAGVDAAAREAYYLASAVVGVGVPGAGGYDAVFAVVVDDRGPAVGAVITALETHPSLAVCVLPTAAGAGLGDVGAGIQREVPCATI